MADYIPLGNWYNQAEDKSIAENATTLSADNIAYMESGITGSLQKSGGTMEGALYLQQKDISEDYEAVHKHYVDNNIRFYKHTTSLTEVPMMTETYLCTIPSYDCNKHLVFLYSTNSTDYDAREYYGSMLMLKPDTKTWTFYNSNTETYDAIKLTSSGEVFFEYRNSHENSFVKKYQFLVVPAMVSTIE